MMRCIFAVGNPFTRMSDCRNVFQGIDTQSCKQEQGMVYPFGGCLPSGLESQIVSLHYILIGLPVHVHPSVSTEVQLN